MAGREIRRIGAWQVPRRLHNYRYRLGHVIHPDGTGRILFVGLNPSTATLTRSDPTVDSFCRRWAEQLGYCELEIVNLFAYRSTDKQALLIVDDPVGRLNDPYIAQAVREADEVVAAWGSYFHPIVAERAKNVVDLIHKVGKGSLCAIGTNSDGSPKHPLYQPCSGRLKPFECNPRCIT